MNLQPKQLCCYGPVVIDQLVVGALAENGDLDNAGADNGARTQALIQDSAMTLLIAD